MTTKLDARMATLGARLTASGASLVADDQLPWDYESPEQTIAINTTITLAHGLAQKPVDVRLVYRCKTAQYGYSVGQEVPVQNHGINYNQGVSLDFDVTNLTIRTTGQAPFVFDKSASNTHSAISSPNWALVAYARK